MKEAIRFAHLNLNRFQGSRQQKSVFQVQEILSQLTRGLDEPLISKF